MHHHSSLTCVSSATDDSGNTTPEPDSTTDSQALQYDPDDESWVDEFQPEVEKETESDQFSDATKELEISHLRIAELEKLVGRHSADIEQERIDQQETVDIWFQTLTNCCNWMCIEGQGEQYADAIRDLEICHRRIEGLERVVKEQAEDAERKWRRNEEACGRLDRWRKDSELFLDAVKELDFCVEKIAVLEGELRESELALERACCSA